MAFSLSIFPRCCPAFDHALHHPPPVAVTFRLRVRYNILLFTQEISTRHEPIAQKLFRHPRRSQSRQRILRNLPPRCARALRSRQALAASLLVEGSPRKFTAPRRRPLRSCRRYSRPRLLGSHQLRRRQRKRNFLHARSRPASGFHGRTCGRRSSSHARRDAPTRRRSKENQSAAAR